jgi:integrase
MPARQRGTTVRRGRTWAARYRDSDGVQRLRGGFATKTEAREWVDRKVNEVEALRDGDVAALRRQEMPTLEALVAEYVRQRVCEPNTLATLTARLKYATATFGEVRLDRLAVSELRAWRATLPAGSAWHIVKALRQVLGYAVAVGLLDTNPAKAIPNPEPKRSEILPFATLDEVEAVAGELLRHYRAIPLVGCLTGLRPSELLALERRDVDRSARVLHVRRVLMGGELRPYGKTAHALRVVPLAEKALEALDAHPARIDTTLLFTTKRGTPIDLHRWRARHWTPALRSAGLPHRGPYAMRHTFASWAIAAGLPTFEIAATMGTSLEQLSKTYAHLLPDSADRARVALDAYINNAAEAAEGNQGAEAGGT